MKRSSLLRLSDDALLSEFAARLARDHTSTAELVVCMAEIDRRKLYRPAGYSSMHKFCVGHFHLSEAAAFKRIHAARLMRRFPAVYDALAKGRVHLTGLVLLMTHLSPLNVDELLTAVTHKSRRQIEKLLAERFPKADLPATIREIAVAQTASPPAPDELFTGRVPEQVPALDGSGSAPTQPAPTEPRDPVIQREHAAQPPASPSPVDRARVTPLSARSYAVQFTMDEATHDLLQQAQELLGHRVAPGDLAGVFSRALRAYVGLLQKAKFAATDRPRAQRRPARRHSRHVSAHVRRVVWERDDGQCTYVSATGHRCEERSNLEYDHVLEYARGGEATVDGIRLRCRAHNQLQAERSFGVEFMQHKRELAASEQSARRSSLANSPRGEFLTGT